uniref:Uncharacterized protein n=1 Tax=Strongyloides papillosus TaxID=174720 RepID=A0A0N5C2L9_STREA
MSPVTNGSISVNLDSKEYEALLKILVNQSKMGSCNTGEKKLVVGTDMMEVCKRMERLEEKIIWYSQVMKTVVMKFQKKFEQVSRIIDGYRYETKNSCSQIDGKIIEFQRVIDDVEGVIGRLLPIKQICEDRIHNIPDGTSDIPSYMAEKGSTSVSDSKEVDSFEFEESDVVDVSFGSNNNGDVRKK